MPNEPSVPPLGEPTLAALCDTVREALAKATPGPWKRDRNWHVTGPDHTWDEDETLDYFPKWKRNQIVAHVHGPPGMRDNCVHNPDADFALIASAPTWLAWLVEGVESIQATAEMTYGQFQEARAMVLWEHAEVTALQAKLVEQGKALGVALLDVAQYQLLLEGTERKLVEAEKERDRMREALEPFTHPDLSESLAGNVQGDASAIYGRDNALLTLGDFRRARAALSTLSAPPGTTREATEEGSE